MKIRRIEIGAFGKFKNFAFDLSDGFNLIFGKNEDGKSTLMAFIAIMLYGGAKFSSPSEPIKSIRDKYLPWSGEKISGDMEIENNGRIYRIHKDFGKTARTDKVSVTDIETGEKIGLPPNTEVGKYFLGIDYQGFEKSLFGATAESFAGAANGDISAKLSNITETGDEDISPKEIISRINSAKEALISKRGNKGALYEVNEKIKELRDRLAVLKLKEERRAVLKQEYVRLEEELALLEKDAQNARLSAKTREKRQKVKLLKQCAAMLYELEEKQKSLSEKVKGGAPEEILKKGTELKNNISFMREKLGNTEVYEDMNLVSEEDMKKLFSLSEEKRTAEAEYAALIEKNETNRGNVFLIFGILIFAVGVIGGFFTAPLFAACALGAVSLIIAMAIKSKSRKQSSDISLSQKQLDEISEKIIALLNSKNCKTAEEFEAAYRMSIAHIEKMKIRKGAENDLKSAQDEFLSFAEAFGASDILSGIGLLEDIKKDLDQITILTKNLDTFRHTYEIEEGDYGKLLNLAQDIEKELPPEEENAVNGEEVALKIRDRNSRLLEIKGQLGEDTENMGELERELNECLDKSAEMTAYYNALSTAAEVMEEAASEMSRTFAPRLMKRASEIMARLTDGKYSTLSISPTYEIELKTGEAGAYRSRQFLSSGTCAQSYLALRIAVCEMLEDGGEKMPLMLDDVLSDYDNDREKQAAEFLEEYSANGRQVIFFTCHDWKGNTSAISLAD